MVAHTQRHTQTHAHTQSKLYNGGADYQSFCLPGKVREGSVMNLTFDI